MLFPRSAVIHAWSEESQAAQTIALQLSSETLSASKRQLPERFMQVKGVVMSMMLVGAQVWAQDLRAGNVLLQQLWS